MSSSPNNSDDSPAPPKTSTVVLLLKEIGSTTWRMFVPTIGGTLLGAYLDTQFGTYPVWVIICIILGVAITTLLIRNQLKKP